MAERDSMKLNAVEAEIKKFHARKGDVILIRHPDLSQQALAPVGEALNARYPENLIIFLAPGQDIERLPESAMEAKGWKRI